MRSRTRAVIGCLVLVLAFPVAPALGAASYEEVGSDVYALLVRLEALGAVRSGLLATRPLSRLEVARLVREAKDGAAGEDEAVRTTLAALERRFAPDDAARFVKPVEDPYARYVFSDSDSGALDYNLDGDRYREGSNVRAGFGVRAELGRAAFFANPEYRHADGGDDLVLRTGYGVFGFSGWDVVIGKDSQWWGPGEHGTLLLTNNAKPLTMVRVANRRPAVLPWIFRYLGLVRLTAFLSRLEEERAVPEPYLWGLRLNLKPSPYVDVGLSRTALLGGEGRPTTLSTWIDSFLGQGENEPGDPGDQRAAIDLTVTVPWDRQPFQVYGELGGEDMANGFLTKSTWAYVLGFYLPRLGGIRAADFRAEFATTQVSHGNPKVWYNHLVYASGYTYKGRIIGHHMGTDSRNLFLASSVWLAGGRGRITVHGDREEHGLSDPVGETKDEAGIDFDLILERGVSVRASYAYGRIENPGGVPSDTETVNRIVGAFTYLF